MSALTFTLKTVLSQDLNCSMLTPDQLAGKTIAEISGIPLTKSKSPLLASDIFDISGNDCEHLIFKGNCARLDYIGAHMTRGSITIDGDAGAYLGYQMTAGSIICNGSSSGFAACCMRGGSLTICGNTGDFLGAGTDGLRKGMLGGTVIIKGNAGDRAGDQMRRGLILIEGNVGDYCGSRMIAGTIGVLGSTGHYAGFNMRRGTLLFKQQPDLHATLQDCGHHTLPFLQLLFKSFATLDTRFNQLQVSRVRRYVGDAAFKGNGEILVLC